eukprot:scaffold38316_cov67-Phaeocystis_antarctica.AAC.4
MWQSIYFLAAYTSFTSRRGGTFATRDTKHHTHVWGVLPGPLWRRGRAKLTASEYDETTWSARTWMAFVTQRLSVAAQLSMAQEAAEALGLSLAANPRAQ